MQDINSSLLQAYSKKPFLSLPMRYNPPNLAMKKADALLANYNLSSKQYICLAPISKKTIKDMPINTCIEFMKYWSNLSKKKILLLGTGEKCLEYSKQLSSLGNLPYIDLVDKTNLSILAAILKKSSALISVDTGTMHLGLACDIPVLSLFYLNDKDHLDKWAPDPEIYNSIILTENFSPSNISKKCLKLINK